jgi:hypothetical protein
MCNTIGYSNLIADDEPNMDMSSNVNENTSRMPSSMKYAHRMRHHHRQFVHQWICIRDITDALITCNHILKGKSIHEILAKMDVWVKERQHSNDIPLKAMNSSSSSLIKTNNVKLFKAYARQLVWDLMEMKYRRINERAYRFNC